MHLDDFVKTHVIPSTQQKTFFHFTDTRNLDLIKKHGILSRRKAEELGVAVPAPGGNQISIHTADALGLDKYVSLCLKTGHPMEGAARKEGTIKVVKYLAIRPDIIKLPGVMMTNDISNKNGVAVREPGEVLDELDLQVMYQRTKWSDPPVYARLKIAEKFEILVPDHVPLEYIKNI